MRKIFNWMSMLYDKQYEGKLWAVDSYQQVWQLL